MPWHIFWSLQKDLKTIFQVGCTTACLAHIRAFAYSQGYLYACRSTMRLLSMHAPGHSSCCPYSPGAVRMHTAWMFCPADKPVRQTVLLRHAQRALHSQTPSVGRACRCLATRDEHVGGAPLAAAALALSLLLQPVNVAAMDYGGATTNAVVQVVSGVVSEEAARTKPELGAPQARGLAAKRLTPCATQSREWRCMGQHPSQWSAPGAL